MRGTQELEGGAGVGTAGKQISYVCSISCPPSLEIV